MDLHYRREATVGLLVVLGTTIFIAGSMWLQGKTFGAKDERRALFRDVTGLKVGNGVTVGGVAAGRVTAIDYAGPGQIRVKFTTLPFVDLREDAGAEVVSVGLVGEYNVKLTPGTSPRPLPKDKEIIGVTTLGLRERLSGFGDKADTLFLGAQAILNQRTADELHATAAQLNLTLKSTQRLMDAYGDPTKGPAAELTATARQFRQLAARMDTLLATPGLARSLQASDTLVRNLAAMSKQLTATGVRFDSLLAGIQRGEGTIGKFAKDTNFYANTTRLTQSMDALVKDLTKHPGKIGVTVKIF